MTTKKTLGLCALLMTLPASAQAGIRAVYQPDYQAVQRGSLEVIYADSARAWYDALDVEPVVFGGSCHWESGCTDDRSVKTMVSGEAYTFSCTEYQQPHSTQPHSWTCELNAAVVDVRRPLVFAMGAAEARLVSDTLARIGSPGSWQTGDKKFTVDCQGGACELGVRRLSAFIGHYDDTYGNVSTELVWDAAQELYEALDIPVRLESGDHRKIINIGPDEAYLFVDCHHLPNATRKWFCHIGTTSPDSTNGLPVPVEPTKVIVDGAKARALFGALPGSGSRKQFTSSDGLASFDCTSSQCAVTVQPSH
jgi:hypothetical protein